MKIRHFDDSKTIYGNSEVKVICDIPIYGVSQEYYNEYWCKKVSEYNNESIIDESVRMHNNRMREIILRNAIWKYNQIVGYIRVSVGAQDINFEDFYSFKRYKRDSNAKHLIEFNGDFHFYIGSMKTNAEILSNIKEYLRLHIGDIQKSHPKFYVDTSVFDNIIDHIDFIEITTELGR